MSKNKYILPFQGEWYIEFGGRKKEHSHSWDIVPQRYAYDFEIRKNDLPYQEDHMKLENYYSYLKEVICPCDGFIINLKDEYKNTKIDKNRKIICDIEDPRGNYLTIKHEHGEYSTLCHFEAGTFQVQLGDIVRAGQVLGKVGNSGNSNGPHIHFQVQKGPGFDQDPGIKIDFKNAYIKHHKVRKLEQGIYVHSKE